MKLLRVCAALACGVLFLTPMKLSLAADGPVKSMAKELLGKDKEAVVSIKLVVTTRYVISGREMNKNDRRSEVMGTVVDPSGMVLISNTSIDPMSGMEFSFDNGGENMAYKPESNVTDMKLVLADGTEIPAEIALRDKDLDLAFIRPKEKLDKPVPYIKFEKTPDPELLDDVIAIGRLGRALNRMNSVSVGNIQAIIKKPRTFYVCDHANLGCPIFDSKGIALGVQVMRKNPVKSSERNMFDYGSALVVVPAEDVAEATKQALIAKKEEAKPDAKDAKPEVTPAIAPAPKERKDE